MPTFAQSRHGLGTLKDGFRGRRTAIATTRDIEHRSTQPVSATLLAPSSLPNRIPASSHCPGQTCLADGGDATMCDEVRHGVSTKEASTTAHGDAVPPLFTSRHTENSISGDRFATTPASHRACGPWKFCSFSENHQGMFGAVFDK